MRFKKIAQELEIDLNDDQIKGLRKLLEKLVGTQSFDKTPVGKQGLVGWITTPSRSGGRVVTSTKMQYVPKLLMMPEYSEFLSLMMNAARNIAKALNFEGERNANQIFHEVFEPISDGLKFLDDTISDSSKLESVLSNAKSYDKDLGSSWAKESNRAIIVNHLKEFRVLYNNEIYLKTLELFDQSGEEIHLEQDEKEKYLPETLVEWMVDQYPKILGLSSDKEIVYKQLNEIEEFDKKTGSNLILEISKFLGKAQKSGLGTEEGPTDDVVEYLQKESDRIFTDLNQIDALVDPNAPDMKLSNKSEVLPGRNVVLQREDMVNRLERDYEKTKSLDEPSLAKVTEINNQIEAVRKKTNSAIAKLEKNVKKEELMFGAGSAEVKAIKDKIKKAKDLEKATIDALEREKSGLLNKKASIMLELGLL